MSKDKILFLIRSDSYLFTLAGIIGHYNSKNVKVAITLIKEEKISARQIHESGVSSGYSVIREKQVFNRHYLQEFSHIFLGAGGEHLIKYSSRIREIFSNDPSRPQIVTLFPGINSYGKYRGFYCRSLSDTILFNTEKELALYENYEAELKFPKVKKFAFGYGGFARFKPLQIADSKVGGNIVTFFEQTEIPRLKRDKALIMSSLFEYAGKYPNRTVYIKPRCFPREKSTHNSKFHYEKLFRKLKKKYKKITNISLTDKTTTELINTSSLIVAMSSGVLLEAISCRKNCAAIADFGIVDRYGNEFFIGSNILKTFSQITNDEITPPSTEWLKENYKEPDFSIIDKI